MNAVHDKVQTFSQTTLRLIMKYIPVNDVLQKRPAQHPERKKCRHSQDRQFTLEKRSVEHVADHGQVEPQRRSWMHMGKELHKIALEHANAFILCGNVGPVHKARLFNSALRAMRRRPAQSFTQKT